MEFSKIMNNCMKNSPITRESKIEREKAMERLKECISYSIESIYEAGEEIQANGFEEIIQILKVQFDKKIQALSKEGETKKKERYCNAICLIETLIPEEKQRILTYIKQEMPLEENITVIEIPKKKDREVKAEMADEEIEALYLQRLSEINNTGKKVEQGKTKKEDGEMEI